MIRDPKTSPLHPEGTYATYKTLDLLEEIANEYTRTTEAFLSVNDMSLPWGGLFDIKGNWQPNHKSHRTGTDVDINRAPLIIIDPPTAADAINCGVDEYLRDAVEKIADKHGSIYPLLRCEPGYDENNVWVEKFKKHIDFD